MAKSLRLDSISKIYRGSNEAAIRDVSLEVQPGEIMALTGESGCGKTTLLRAIAGFEEIQEGSITIGDQIVGSPKQSLSSEKRGVSLVFQDLALFPHMTVSQNIAYGLSKLSRTEKQERIDEVLSLTHLSAYSSRYPHQLSGGQQQRVALARALAVKPNILLMDEPFSNLDELLKVQVRKEIKAIIKQSGITTILVSHDATDAFGLANRIAVLQKGALIQTGSPKEIYQTPKSPYVARFFGEISIISGIMENGQVQTKFGKVKIDAIKDDLSIGIRPESITIDSKGSLKGIVSDSVFQHGVYDLIVKADDSSEHLHVYSTTNHELGASVTLHIDLSQIIQF